MSIEEIIKQYVLSFDDSILLADVKPLTLSNVQGHVFLFKYSQKFNTAFANLLNAYMDEFNNVADKVSCVVWCDDGDRESVRKLIETIRKASPNKKLLSVFLMPRNIEIKYIFTTCDTYVQFEFDENVLNAMAYGSNVLTVWDKNNPEYHLEDLSIKYLGTILKESLKKKDRNSIKESFKKIIGLVQKDIILDVSVCVLTHNNPKLICECLEALRQYSNVREILVLDNGSTINNDAIKQYKDDRVRIFKSNQNIGVIKGRNLLADKAMSKYLLFLDDDQIVSQHSVNKLYSAVLSGCDFAGAVLNEFDPNASGVELKEYKDNEWVYLGAGGLIIEREIFNKIGKFDEGFGMAYCEDVDLHWRLRDGGYKWKWVSGAGVEHKEHSTLFTQKTFVWKYEWDKNHKALRSKWGNKFNNRNMVVNNKNAEIIIDDESIRDQEIESIIKDRVRIKIIKGQNNEWLNCIDDLDSYLVNIYGVNGRQLYSLGFNNYEA